MSEQQENGTPLIGLELGPDKVIAAFVDGENFHYEQVAGITSSTRPADRIINAIEWAIKHEKGGAVKGFGIAIPGLVDSRSGHIIHSQIVDIDDIGDLSMLIKESTGLNVRIENDANAAAIAELRFGAARGHSNLFYVTLGEGIGGAIVIDGKIWRGDCGYAGEFGDVAINSEGMRLEEIASAKNILRRTRNRFHQDSTSSLSRLAEDEITIDAIVDAANQDDDFALMMLERTGSYVGTAIASVINLLNINRIVIGGEIMGAGNIVLDAINKRAGELAFSPAFKETSIVAGELGSGAGAIGAALLPNTNRPVSDAQ